MNFTKVLATLFQHVQTIITPRDNAAVGKFVAYVFGVLPAALLQLIMVILFFWFRSHSLTWAQLAGDGALFFFATSLQASTIYDTLQKGMFSYSPMLVAATCISCLALISLSFVGYLTVLTMTDSPSSLLGLCSSKVCSATNWCLIMSLAYCLPLRWKIINRG
jgi:hypothetical protein